MKERQQKLGMSRRLGWRGDAARYWETFLASEEKSTRVMQRLLRGRRDSNPLVRGNPLGSAWELVREDAGSLFRLGLQPKLVAGYLTLGSAERLVPHAVAIASRAGKLERFAPGILVAVDGYLDVVEPHLDNILDR